MKISEKYSLEELKKIPTSKDELAVASGWKALFDSHTLYLAEFPAMQKRIRAWHEDWSGSFQVRYDNGVVVTLDGWPESMSEEWRKNDLYVSPRNTPQADVYMAGAMFFLEKKRGPFIQYENTMAYRIRQDKLRFLQHLKNQEVEREAVKPQEQVLSLSLFPGESGQTEEHPLFDAASALEQYRTDTLLVQQTQELLAENKDVERQVSAADPEPAGEKESLHFLIHVRDENACASCSGDLQGSRLLSLHTVLSVLNYYYREEGILTEMEYEPGDTLDAYTQAALLLLNRYLRQHPYTVQTDESAWQFFQQMSRSSTPAADGQEKADARKAHLVLQPRIVTDTNSVVLSFRIGRSDGKLFVLKDWRNFVLSYERQAKYPLGKNVSLDFSVEDFTEDSGPYLYFISSRVMENEEINERLSRRSTYAQPLTVGHQVSLEGSALDTFYELTLNRQAVVYDRRLAREHPITIGPEPVSFLMQVKKVLDAHQAFAGIQITGKMPAILPGTGSLYSLSDSHLSRLSPEEVQMVRPFLGVASSTDGSFSFTIAPQQFPEFYYRILPRLESQPGITVKDEAAEEVSAYLPPQAEFSFLLDLQEDRITCQAFVQYGEEQLPLTDSPAPDPQHKRDVTQEMRVIALLKELFVYYDPKSRTYLRAVRNDDQLYEFLTVDLARLEAFGPVQGTEAFRKVHIRPVPRMKAELSLGAAVGLMEFSVTSENLSQKELLEVFQSYKLKKRYHRLRSGDFLDLEDDTSLADLEELFSQLDTTDLEVLRSKAHIPVYRALYVNKLLEQHDQLIAERDQTIKAMIRGVDNLRNSDFEVPESLKKTLRPYQVYGYQWFCTLQAAGFGGILADEMGLGKTLQAIALLLHDKEAGVQEPALVVCPASLVFNWLEEIHRFAPALQAVTVTGTAAARKKILEHTDEDVFITSYDLLKRDLPLYEGRVFSVFFLDEAQYIKNASAAQSRAVKAVQARHRFALTGTPIENRLSELWSIFDFLMPGFLYSAKEFQARLEGPIAHGDAEAQKKLKDMTGPFILRRQKEEVLKDLPEKLEEVHYARLEGEQQKLYDAETAYAKQLLKTAEKQDLQPGSRAQEKIRILAELTRIREICCDPSLIFEGYHQNSAKRQACLELIQSGIDGGHRMLVFSQFTSMLALLEEDLKKAGIACYVLTGSTPKARRLELVHAFNEGDVPVFLISLKAGGTGLNLTGADVVIHYDPWWNLAAQNQATDRAHRIGQTRQVTVYKLILKDAIEEKILQLQEAKKDLAEAVLSGRSESLLALSEEELLQLLEG